MRIRAGAGGPTALLRRWIGSDDEPPTCGTCSSRLDDAEARLTSLRDLLADAQRRLDLLERELRTVSESPAQAARTHAAADEQSRTRTRADLTAQDRRVAEAHRVALESARAIEFLLEGQLELQQRVDTVDGSGR